jgi:hypothetical protein
MAEADTLLLTIPNQLGVAYNTHVMEAILTPRLALNRPQNQRSDREKAAYDSLPTFSPAAANHRV